MRARGVRDAFPRDNPRGHVLASVGTVSDAKWNNQVRHCATPFLHHRIQQVRGIDVSSGAVPPRATMSTPAIIARVRCA